MILALESDNDNDSSQGAATPRNCPKHAEGYLLLLSIALDPRVFWGKF